MKILMITAADNRGMTLAGLLAQKHEITVLHEGKTESEYPFEESEINESALSAVPFADYDAVVWLTSEKLPCRYLTAVLPALRNTPAVRCLCIAESRLNLSAGQKDTPEKYICRGFRDGMPGRLSFWTTSPVYGDSFFPDEMMDTALKRVSNNRIVLPGSEEQMFDMLHAADLAAAVDQALAGECPGEELDLTSGQQSPLKELGDALQKLLPQANIAYKNQPECAAGEGETDGLEGWMPTHSFFDDLPSVVKAIEENGETILRAGRTRRTNHAVLLVSFLGLFALVCVYTGFVKVSPELQYVDVRLLFIISACLFWGSRYGLAAAVLCSAASVVQSVLGGTQWHVIFFHIDNWIPIAVYLAAAVLFGMYHNNRTQKAE